VEYGIGRLGVSERECLRWFALEGCPLRFGCLRKLQGAEGWRGGGGSSAGAACVVLEEAAAPVCVYVCNGEDPWVFIALSHNVLIKDEDKG
jgi:hypothetical protein